MAEPPRIHLESLSRDNAKGLSKDRPQLQRVKDLRLNIVMPEPDYSLPPKRGANFETPKMTFVKETPTPLLSSPKHKFGVKLTLNAAEKANYVDPCVLFRVFLNVAQKHNSNLCIYPYEDEDTRNPLQCPQAVPTEIEETKAFLYEQTSRRQAIKGYAKIVSKLTFGQIKSRLMGWIQNYGHYMAFIGIKSTNSVNVGFLINFHPQNTNFYQLSNWIRSELNLNQNPLLEFNIFFM